MLVTYTQQLNMSKLYTFGKLFFFFSISSVLLLFSVCSIDLLPTGIQHLLINLDFVSLSKRNFASNTSNYLNIFHTSILRKQYFIFKISE